MEINKDDVSEGNSTVGDADLTVELGCKVTAFRVNGKILSAYCCLNAGQMHKLYICLADGHFFDNLMKT